MSDIIDESPAEKGGLEQGDVIVEFNDVPIQNSSHLKNIVSSTSPGTLSTVKIIRDGIGKYIYITLEELDASENPKLSSTIFNDHNFGLEVQDVNESLQKKYNLELIHGVVVTHVTNNSEAFDAGIQEGDIITRIGTKKVGNKNDFKSKLQEAKNHGPVLLLIKRDDVFRFVALETS